MKNWTSIISILTLAVSLVTLGVVIYFSTYSSPPADKVFFEKYGRIPGTEYHTSILEEEILRAFQSKLGRCTENCADLKNKIKAVAPLVNPTHKAMDISGISSGIACPCSPIGSCRWGKRGLMYFIFNNATTKVRKVQLQDTTGKVLVSGSEPFLSESGVFGVIEMKGAELIEQKEILLAIETAQFGTESLLIQVADGF
ncbi:MAG: hypothetical protein EP344_11575 [Bacteroidetes bacterium]|nr:MAG: hypothetical protein EP344_11575 [Bacteroidota bacterium]